MGLPHNGQIGRPREITSMPWRALWTASLQPEDDEVKEGWKGGLEDLFIQAPKWGSRPGLDCPNARLD